MVNLKDSLNYATSLDPDDAPLNMGTHMRSKWFETQKCIYLFKSFNGSDVVSRFVHNKIQ